LFAAGTGTAEFSLQFTASNEIEIYDYTTPSYAWRKITTSLYRDPSAWYMITLAYDTTQATASNRIKLYVNGTQVTAFSTSSDPSLNYDGYINNNTGHAIGAFPSAANFFSGYLTEINFIDGSALDPTSFGEFNTDTGVWQPKKYTGTYGTNGFYLDFADNTSTTTLGYDAAGSNDWTLNNFSVTAGAGNDSLVDSPTRYGTDTGAGGEVRGNYATLNPLENSSATFSQGNLRVVTSTTAGKRSVGSTILVSSGSWYCEVECVTNGSSSAAIGIANTAFVIGSEIGTNCYAYYNDGTKIINGSSSAYGASYTNGDIIGIAFDADSGTLTFYKNGSSQGAISSIPAGTYRIAVAGNSSLNSSTFEANFGQRPFAYTAPSGFKALCTTNLPEPIVADGGEYFNTVTYAGSPGVAGSVTGVGFQPDFVWVKARNAATGHVLVDAVRGVQKGLFSALTNAEITSNEYLTSFNADGFSYGISNAYSQTSMVSWNWKANGAGSSNTDGTITSTVSVNTTSGFSIVTYTGTGSAATVGHGLGAVPRMIIVKNRDATDAWQVYHAANTANPETDYLVLNTTAATADAADRWNDTLPTSTVFSIGNGVEVNTNTEKYVAYCFAPVAGYSAFGSYTGNGNADGPFVYTGFRPRYVMIKRTDAISNWFCYDGVRDDDNAVGKLLWLNLSNSENNGGADIVLGDFLANGFKIRDSANFNTNTGTYIYAAFAENPFKYALAR
jgi:hypothetical protein